MASVITRRDFMKSVAAGCAALSIPGIALAAEKPKMKRPNIVLITADDLNCDSVGVFGCKISGITPNIDKLASEGVRFAHAHVTIAVCQPSRSVLMTGRYPHRNGARGFEPIDPSVTTLQERLRAAGYLNGIMAKNSHLQPVEKFCWDYVIAANQLEQGRAPSLYHSHAKAFFEQAKAAGKPFFLMANSQDPHRPFAGSDAEMNLFGKHMPYSRKVENSEAEVSGFLPDIPGVREEVAQYFTSVHRCDETVGEVLRALDETGNRENTLVMFLSDNGMSFPFAKTNCYLASTHTPWIARWPGRIKPGKVDGNHFISGIDYMPTIIEAAGLDKVSGMDGKSFHSILTGGRESGREHAFTCFEETAGRNQYPMRCIQSTKYGYIYNAWSDGKTEFKNEAQGGMAWKAMLASTDPKVQARAEFFLYRTPEELYDLGSDPNCLVNLAEQPKHKYAKDGVLQDMRRLLLNNMAATKDPILEPFKAFIATGKQTWQAEPKKKRKGAGG